MELIYIILSFITFYLISQLKWFMFFMLITLSFSVVYLLLNKKLLKDKSDVNIIYWGLYQILEFFEISYLFINSLFRVIIKLPLVSRIHKNLIKANNHYLCFKNNLKNKIFENVMKFFMNRMNNVSNIEKKNVKEPEKKVFESDEDMNNFLDNIISSDKKNI